MSLARAMVLGALRRVRNGRIELREGGRRHLLGPPDADLAVTVEVRDPSAWRRCLRGSHGVADAYLDGAWDCDDLVTLVRIGARELPRLDPLRRAILPLRRVLERVPRNTLRAARLHIGAHYDLGNDLFAAFLDETMSYSSATFDTPGMTLREAQEAKLDRICRALELTPDDHLLEIGSGWGGLAIHAAGRYGCRVTTTTISREQRALARARVQAAGLEDRVTVLLDDYRDLGGRYDKLVSVEMIEAVGWQYFDTFFDRCAALLTPGGLMLLQAITIDDRFYELEKAARSFANTHVFPSGCLPSLPVIRRCAGRVGLDERAADDLTDSYPPTLRRWRENFLAAEPEIAALGYDERFRRLWDLYLRWSEGGFLERRIEVHQLLFERVNMRDEIASSSSAGPREASLATASFPPGPSTAASDRIAATTFSAQAEAG
jgi:cyclopropane-fatty-acyl-phospholipid synthase